VVNVGDVNGDGYDDFTLVENTGGAKYVVYGRAGLTAVELSTLTTVGSTNGFIISGGTSYNTTAGDYNGDGLNDILVQNATTGTYVVEHRKFKRPLQARQALVNPTPPLDPGPAHPSIA
jgi:hypothetical protein